LLYKKEKTIINQNILIKNHLSN
jgi:hypothetical protein